MYSPRQKYNGICDIINERQTWLMHYSVKVSSICSVFSDKMTSAKKMPRGKHLNVNESDLTIFI